LGVFKVWLWSINEKIVATGKQFVTGDQGQVRPGVQNPLRPLLHSRSYLSQLESWRHFGCLGCGG
jgi:hypothetical protein